jgi:O-antigen/teichoic acid export membrane protein
MDARKNQSGGTGGVMVRAPGFSARLWSHARDPSAALLGTQMISIVLRLGSNLLLAHLLVPRDFGLLAITTLIATALAMLSDVGAWVSIVRKGEGVDRDWLDQLWTLNAVRGVILWLVALSITPLVASLYGERQLLWLLPVANLWQVIQGLESLYPFVRNKDLKPGLTLKMQLMTQVVGSLFSIVGALIYPSPWALVGGLLAGAAASAIMSHVWAREPLPRPHMTREFLKDQWKLASWLTVSTALGFFGGQIDRLLFPAWFGTTEFGVYSIALTLALFPLQLGQRWADSLYMPAIAKLSQAGSAAAGRQLQSLCRSVIIYAAVGSALLAGVGTAFFHALYPARFAAAGSYIQILAVTTYATFITYLHRRTFLYQGMTRLEASIEASRLFLFLAAVGAAIFFVRKPAALEYVGIFAAVQAVVYAVLMTIGRIKRLVHFRDDLPGHAIFITVTAGMILLDQAIEQRSNAWVALLICGGLGGILALATAARLGLPKLQVNEQVPEAPPQDIGSSLESFDPLQEA